MTTNKISGLVSKLKAGVPAAASKDAAGASLPTATKEEAKVEPEPEVIEIPEATLPSFCRSIFSLFMEVISR